MPAKIVINAEALPEPAVRVVEPGEVYRFVDKKHARETGRLLLVHCLPEDDEVHLLACPAPEQQPFDDRALFDFYHEHRPLADEDEDKQAMSLTYPDLVYTRLRNLHQGSVALLIGHTT